MTATELLVLAAADARALATLEGRDELGTLGDGTPVFTKKGVSHLANHPEVQRYIKEVLERLTVSDFKGRDLATVLDMGRIVGTSDCVETSSLDTVVFRRRKGRKDGCSRIVFGRTGTPCSNIMVRLYLNADGLVALMTAYVGNDNPPEPCTPSGRKDGDTWEAACGFWYKHALIVKEDDLEATEYTEWDFVGPYVP